MDYFKWFNHRFLPYTKYDATYKSPFNTCKFNASMRNECNFSDCFSNPSSAN